MDCLEKYLEREEKRNEDFKKILDYCDGKLKELGFERHSYNYDFACHISSTDVIRVCINSEKIDVSLSDHYTMSVLLRKLFSRDYKKKEKILKQIKTRIRSFVFIYENGLY